ncbi:MAG: DMT family transporter [Bacteroidales bacterium]|nr:DMT family transporter [Bacteroidales bacterium]MCF8387336.1 DMT family transporter [Bacteroidales bacterium]MCF8398032.1 DMT family transporter [Bacteroidales bacterium]
MYGSKNTLKAHLALLGANLLYGLNYVIAKGMMPEYFAPRAIILIRVAGAVVFFWAFHFFMINEKVRRKDLLRLVLCALFGVATNQILFFEGLNLTTPINASIIMLVVPILVLLFSNMLLNEVITKNKITGILIGLSGAGLLILSGGSLSFTSSTFTGNLLVFINAAAFGFYLVLVKPMMVKYKALTVMKWVFLFGFIYVFPLCIGPFMQTDFSVIPLRFWFSLLYVVAGTTILAYLLFNYSLKHVSPVVSSIYMYSQPVIASLTAVSIGMDMLIWQQGIAAILVFTGVYFVSIRKSRPIRK